MSVNENESWSSYWSSGNLTTFNNNFNDGYDGTIEDFWLLICKNLQKEQVITDFCTGNGAVMSLFDQYAKSKGIRTTLIGVDSSIINPDAIEFESKNDIKFLSTTNIEDTGIDDNSVDFVTSQFGIEYTNLKASILEASRISKRESTIALICHTTDSKILEETGQKLEQIKFCEKKTKLLHNIKMLIRVMGDLEPSQLSSKDKKRSEKLRKFINIDLEKLNDLINSSISSTFASYFVKELTGVFDKNKKVKGVNERMIYINKFEKEVLEFKNRLQDLVSAALTETTLSELKENIKEQRYIIKICEHLVYKEQIIGIKLIASRKI